MKKVGIIGAGSLGTALAQTMSENVDEVILQLRRENIIQMSNWQIILLQQQI